MPTNSIGSLGDMILNALGRRDLEKRYEQESMGDLQRFLATRGLGVGAPVAQAPGVGTSTPIGTPVPGRAPGVVVGADGGVRDGRGWFSAEPARWINDSERLFTADAPASDVPTGGAGPAAAGPAAAAPAVGRGTSNAGAPAPAAGAGMDVGGLHQYMLLAQSAGIDPQVAMKLLDAHIQRQQRQTALEGLPDTYSRANAAFGRSVQLPFAMNAQGTVNHATGEVVPSDYARAATAAQQANAAAAFAGADATAARADQTRALTPAQVAATEALTGQRQASESKQLRVKLQDGRIGEVRPGPDGKLQVVPILDVNGQPARGSMATQARESARGQTPQQFLADRYKVRSNQFPRDPAKAAAMARQDTTAVFGDVVSSGGESPAPLIPEGPASAGVPGAGMSPGPAVGGAGSGPDPLTTAVQAALAKIDRDAAEVLRARPDLAARVSMEADAKKRAILQNFGQPTR